MIEDELIKIWQSSPNQERVKFEKSRLMIDVQSSVDRFHKGIKNRDLMETIAAILGIPVFVYYSYSSPHILTKIASVLIALWGIYVIIRLRNTRKHKPGALTETYLEYLYKTRDYLKLQKQLLDSVLYWYILPAMIFMFLYILGPGITGRLVKILNLSVGLVAGGAFVYYLNKRAVKKQFNPRLEKIEELIKVMEKT
jgi:hypothetical protein